VSANLIDIGNNSIGTTTALLFPVAVSTAGGVVNSAAQDCNSAVFPLSVSMTTGVFTSPGSLAMQLQYATDDPANPGSPLAASWTNIVAQTNFPTSLTATVSNLEQWLMIEQLPYNGRYVRAVLTVTGGGASVLVQMDLIAQAKITGSGNGTTNSPQT
jgi:hypothetical protein